jgi:hypothetical protein
LYFNDLQKKEAGQAPFKGGSDLVDDSVPF